MKCASLVAMAAAVVVVVVLRHVEAFHTSRRGDQPGDMGAALPAVQVGPLVTASPTDSHPPTTAPTFAPSVPPPLAAVQAIVTSLESTYAVLTNDIRAWGANDNGQLGSGDLDNRGDGPGEMGGNLLPPLDLGVPRGLGVRNLSAGTVSQHVCAVMDDRITLKCWGWNLFGQLGYEDAVARGGAPWQMGSNLSAVDLGTLGIGTGEIRQVALSQRHTCVLFGNGRLKCFGSGNAGALGSGDTVHRGNNVGEMGDALPFVDVGSGVQVEAVTAGGTSVQQHTCVLLNTSSIKCWGANLHGQLGQGDNRTRGDEPGEMGDALPVVDLGTNRKARQVDCGWFTCCALLDDASVKCWGNNDHGQNGQGDSVNRGDDAGEMGDALLPVPIFGPGEQAAAGNVSALCVSQAVCALMAHSGKAKCWGTSSAAQLAEGDNLNKGDNPGEMGAARPFLDLGSGVRIDRLSCGGRFLCALLNDSSVKCWGRNVEGQLGYGDQIQRGDDMAELGDNMLRVNVGAEPTLAPSVSPTLAPTPYLTLPLNAPVHSLTVSGDAVCAHLQLSLHMRCWGLNTEGQLGAGDTASRGLQKWQMGSNLSTVDLGPGRVALNRTNMGFSAHFCVILQNGIDLKCWGGNGFGQLGYEDVNSRGDEPGEMGGALPMVDLGTNVGPIVALHSGHRHSCALFLTGSVKCFGQGTKGQLGLGGIATLGDHPGEMGNGLPFVDLGASKGASSIFAGYDHTCALMNDSHGAMKCWGDNGVGQLGYEDTAKRGDGANEMGDSLAIVNVGSNLRVAQGAGGQQHTCVLLNDSTVKCFGAGANGRLGYEDGTTRGDTVGEMGNALPAVNILGSAIGVRVVEVSCALLSSCALISDGHIKCWGNNAQGQLGQGDSVFRGDNPGEMGDSLPPVRLGAAVHVTRAIVGMQTVCVLLNDSSVKCFGKNTAGQLGYGDSNPRGDLATEMGQNLPRVNIGPLVTLAPTTTPSLSPTISPNPSFSPTLAPSQYPTEITMSPTLVPTSFMSPAPSDGPSSMPTLPPSTLPSGAPTPGPTPAPSITPSLFPSTQPSAQPTPGPTRGPTILPTSAPTNPPSPFPSAQPTPVPSPYPTRTPTSFPTLSPTQAPTPVPTRTPTSFPTPAPTQVPTPFPTQSPTQAPTEDAIRGYVAARPATGPAVPPETADFVDLMLALQACAPAARSVCDLVLLPGVHNLTATVNMTKSNDVRIRGYNSRDSVNFDDRTYVDVSPSAGILLAGAVSTRVANLTVRFLPDNLPPNAPTTTVLRVRSKPDTTEGLNVTTHVADVTFTSLGRGLRHNAVGLDIVQPHGALLLSGVTLQGLLANQSTPRTGPDLSFVSPVAAFVQVACGGPQSVRLQRWRIHDSRFVDSGAVSVQHVFRDQVVMSPQSTARTVVDTLTDVVVSMVDVRGDVPLMGWEAVHNVTVEVSNMVLHNGAFHQRACALAVDHRHAGNGSDDEDGSRTVAAVSNATFRHTTLQHGYGVKLTARGSAMHADVAVTDCTFFDVSAVNGSGSPVATVLDELEGGHAQIVGNTFENVTGCRVHALEVFGHARMHRNAFLAVAHRASDLTMTCDDLSSAVVVDVTDSDALVLIQNNNFSSTAGFTVPLVRSANTLDGVLLRNNEFFSGSYQAAPGTEIESCPGVAPVYYDGLFVCDDLATCLDYRGSDPKLGFDCFCEDPFTGNAFVECEIPPGDLRLVPNPLTLSDVVKPNSSSSSVSIINVGRSNVQTALWTRDEFCRNGTGVFNAQRVASLCLGMQTTVQLRQTDGLQEYAGNNSRTGKPQNHLWRLTEEDGDELSLESAQAKACSFIEGHFNITGRGLQQGSYFSLYVVDAPGQNGGAEVLEVQFDVSVASSALYTQFAVFDDSGRWLAATSAIGPFGHLTSGENVIVRILPFDVDNVSIPTPTEVFDVQLIPTPVSADETTAVADEGVTTVVCEELSSNSPVVQTLPTMPTFPASGIVHHRCAVHALVHINHTLSVSVSSQSVDSLVLSADCGTAYVTDSALCTCGPGEYLDPDTLKQCLPCGLNFYKSESGNSLCDPCPVTGMTTNETGTSDSANCLCAANTYLRTANQGEALECAPCLTGADCNAQGYTLETMRIKGSYWRASADSENVLICPTPKACIGHELRDDQKTYGDSLCRAGHTGPTCAVCQKDWYESYSGVCRMCSADSLLNSYVLMAVLVGVATVLVYYVVRTTAVLADRMQNGDEADPTRALSLFDHVEKTMLRTAERTVEGMQRRVSGLQRRLSAFSMSSGGDTDGDKADEGQSGRDEEAPASRARPAGKASQDKGQSGDDGDTGAKSFNARGVIVKMKILFVFFQVVLLFQSSYAVAFPTEYLNFLDLFSFVSLDWFQVTQMECAVTGGFGSRLLLSCCIPLGIVFVLVAIWVYSRHSYGEGSDGLEVVRNTLVNLFLVLTYVLFPSLSTTIFSTFVCEEFDDGTNLLRADYAISCETAEYQRLVVFASFMIIVYPIGIPAMYTYFLYSHRDNLNPQRQTPDMPLSDVIVHRETHANYLKFLFDAFKPKYYWMEVFECFRKLALTGFIVFMYRDSSMQIYLGILISVGAVMVYCYTRPYLFKSNNIFSIFAHTQITVTLVGASMLRYNEAARESNDAAVRSSYSGRDIAVLLIVSNVLVLSVGAFLIAWTCMRPTAESDFLDSGMVSDGKGGYELEQRTHTAREMREQAKNETKREGEDKYTRAPHDGGVEITGLTGMWTKTDLRDPVIHESEQNKKHGGGVWRKPSIAHESSERGFVQNSPMQPVNVGASASGAAALGSASRGATSAAATAPLSAHERQERRRRRSSASAQGVESASRRNSARSSAGEVSNPLRGGGGSAMTPSAAPGLSAPPTSDPPSPLSAGSPPATSARRNSQRVYFRPVK